MSLLETHPLALGLALFGLAYLNSLVEARHRSNTIRELIGQSPPISRLRLDAPYVVRG